MGIMIMIATAIGMIIFSIVMITYAIGYIAGVKEVAKALDKEE